MCVTASRSRGSRFQVLGQATSWPGHVTAARTGGPSKTVGAQEARLMVVRRHGCYYHPFLHSIGDHAPSRAESMIRSFALISNNRVGMEWKERMERGPPDHHTGWFRERVRITCLERREFRRFLRRSMQSRYMPRIRSKYIYTRDIVRITRRGYVIDEHTSKISSITEGWIEFSILFPIVRNEIRRFVELTRRNNVAYFTVRVSLYKENFELWVITSDIDSLYIG